MKHKNFVARFYRKAEKRGDKDEFLGSIELSDHGVNQHFTVQAKAFRQAPPKCVNADRVTIQQV